MRRRPSQKRRQPKDAVAGRLLQLFFATIFPIKNPKSERPSETIFSKIVARRAADPDVQLSSEERQQNAAQRWLEYRQAQKDHPGQEKDLGQEKDIERTKDRGPAIDDDFSL